MDQQVTEYIEKQEPWQKEVCNTLRKMIYDVIPDVVEKIQYGKPHYTKNGKYACVMQPSKDKVTLVIFNALELEDIKGFFASTTSPERKTATIKPKDTIDYGQLASLLSKASASL